MKTSAGRSVGIVGLGHMGTPVACSLCKAGFDVVGYDVDPTRVAALVEPAVLRGVGSAGDVAAAAATVITLLPASPAVEAVFDAPDGLLAAARPGQVFIDMGSSHPASTIELGRRVAAKGAVLTDAPVSGGVARAETGDLALMVGGDRAAIEQVMPILDAVASSVTLTGPLGSAHAMKALNNLLSANGLAAAIEVLIIGQRYGLQPDSILKVLNASTGMNYATLHKVAPRVLSRTFDAGFALALMAKDLEIAEDLARELEEVPPLTRATVELWRQARDALDGNPDHTAIALWLESRTGITLHA
jgi:3-hydroxyisobutyrate dehydrogenase